VRKKLEPYEKANLKGAPKNPDQALIMFMALAKKQKTTPVFVKATDRGLVYSLREFPSYRACFRTLKPGDAR